ncbi:2-polyprenyl-6-methoxyphenol hydroxylase-like FAD-dependent oxidoreductase [Streptomyces sp. 3211.6]|uniref:NAD(P)/FAD-dependent oxidoreductase n=1 Tax=Streptomyces sp. 3211.6 TaxID=1938845 RepID=UPI000EAF1F10|nr:NAD(P)-binding protein [Streptomyces sp. 3211.6]RKT07830.1 2-polyprenyl-6-methoxyphenol hydroxylase-like FAD-dependent oxidoreductase [Streptomyces sp. 3211.6]
MAHVLVIGGGVAGLATALLAARRGHTAEVFERDTRAPGAAPDRGLPAGDVLGRDLLGRDVLGRDLLDRDFFGWHRPGVPQAAQPHLLLGAARAVLRAELPDVYAEMLRLGARERHELDWFDVRPPARPGDEDLVLVQARRIVLESALTTALRAQPGAVVRYGEPVTGLTATGGRQPRITGVSTPGGGYGGDLVVDAAGRRGGCASLLATAGCRPGTVERHRTGLAYFCRWYRLPDGVDEGPRRPWTVTGGAFAGCAVFPSDNRVFAVTVFAHTGDPTRGALRDPAVFEAAARAFPPGAAWLGLGAEPLSGVLATAGLDNRWSPLADARGPVVSGMVPVGDALTHTNPTLGQGTSLALWAADRVARTAHRDPGSPGFAAGYHGWALRTLKPWFDFQAGADAAVGARLAAGAGAGVVVPGGGGAGSLAGRAREAAALFECALEDPEVMRARARVRHLAEPPGRAYADPAVRARVAIWLARRPDWAPNAVGPDRARWEELTAAAAVPPQPASPRTSARS